MDVGGKKINYEEAKRGNTVLTDPLTSYANRLPVGNIIHCKKDWIEKYLLPSNVVFLRLSVTLSLYASRYNKCIGYFSSKKKNIALH